MSGYVITMKQLLEAGVHFGHQTKRWNPKMDKYIFTQRNGIYIIDLQQTVDLFQKTYDFLKQSAKEGKYILFVGTKKQAHDSVFQEGKRAQEAGAKVFYVHQRWLGGTLTNYSVLSSRIKYMLELEERDKSGELDKLSKKEANRLRLKLKKMHKYFDGIKDMDRVPDIIFIIDPKKEHIALAEAVKLGLTITGMVDTNCDPDPFDYPIPANDDAIRAIKLILSKITDGIIEGTLEREKLIQEEKEREKENQDKEQEETVFIDV